MAFARVQSAVFRLTYHQLGAPVVVTRLDEPIGTYVPWDAPFAIVPVAQTPRSGQSVSGGEQDDATGKPSAPSPRPASRTAGRGGAAPAGAYPKSKQTGRKT